MIKEYSIAIISLMVFHTHIAMADIATGNIGAKASGMAGAFAAQADDLSAIIYNPAGLIHFKSQGGFKAKVSIDVSESISSKDGELTSDFEQGLIGGRVTKDNMSVGIAMYKVALPNLIAAQQGGQSTIGQVIDPEQANADFHLSSMGMFFAMQYNDDLSWGAHVEILAPRGKYIEQYHTDKKTQAQIGYRLGVLYSAMNAETHFLSNSMYLDWQIGLALNSAVDSYNENEAAWRPESTVLGSHVNWLWLNDYFKLDLTINADLERTDSLETQGMYHDEIMIQRLGVEWQLPFFFNSNLLLRAGKTRYSDDDLQLSDLNSFGLSLLGVNHALHYHFREQQMGQTVHDLQGISYQYTW